MRRSGAFLALAALALQIVLSFGHVHAEGIGGAPHAAGLRKSAIVQAPQQAPAQNPAGDADDYCAICASIFLVSSSFTPAPPQLPLPDGFIRIEHLVAAAQSVATPRQVAFRSRAPPVV